jgi:hypothetical protein
MYISCPISIAQSELDEVVKTLMDLGCNPNYWVRGTHYNKSSIINNCDGLVLVLPELKWEYVIDALPEGCKRELKLAITAKRKIYLAYITSDRVFGIYDTDTSNGTISGVTRTRHSYDSFEPVRLESKTDAAGKPFDYICERKDGFLYGNFYAPNSLSGIPKLDPMPSFGGEPGWHITVSGESIHKAIEGIFKESNDNRLLLIF